MDEETWLQQEFDAHRDHLRAIAYRMLGSVPEADDAVQEAWLRLHRADTSDVRNLGGWLTTVVSRVALDMLRTRRSRREEALGIHVPEPVVTAWDRTGPEAEAVLADSVGLALLVVLETLAPAERLAFVLHDLFAMPFDEIAPIVGRSSQATRQLASRARRRVQGRAPTNDDDHAKQREIVDAFLAASRAGDFEGLLALLDPDVVLRADVGAAVLGQSHEIRGAENVVKQALLYSRFAPASRPVLVNGGPGAMTAPEGRPMSVMGFTIVGGKIVELDILADPERLQHVDVASLGG